MSLQRPAHRSSTASKRMAQLVVTLGVLAGASATTTQAAEGWPESVRALYDVNFNGINVGTFEFNSEARGATYTLAGKASLSLLLGAFKWSGDTRSSGNLGGVAPKPSGFTFDFKSNSKSGSTKMSFADDTVTSVNHVPPPKVRDNIVPILAQHLKGTLDPLSAILLLSKGTAANPCTRRLPIYDGKQRFDLMLAPRGEVQLSEKQPSGQPGTGYVCKVRYLPIAGHKADEETKYMSKSDSIEIILRPIPSANVFVPYQITIPTIAGAATLVSRRVDIVTSTRQQIALVH